MPITIKLSDIDEAIASLGYKSATTLKARLIHAIRKYYASDESSDVPSVIDTEDLVKAIWETGDDPALIKARRKNFSSIKSSVNTDLKKLFSDGKNPQGLVIGPANIFTVSDEAKDRALSGIMDAFKDKGIDTTSKITDILSALGDVLASAEAGSVALDSRDEIERLKEIMGGISEKLGMSLTDVIRQAEAVKAGGASSDAMSEAGADLSGYIREGLNTLETGLQGLSHEAAAGGPHNLGAKASVRKALADMVEALKDTQTETAAKAQKILSAVDRILSDAIDATGDALSGDEVSEIKQIISGLYAQNEVTGGGEKAPASGESPIPSGASELLSHVASILADESTGFSDKIGSIMTAVNDMIGEALAKAGDALTDDEKERIGKMMENITGNLAGLASQAIDEVDIIEEIVEGDDDDVEIYEDEGAGSKTQDARGELLDDAVIVEENAGDFSEELIEVLEDEVEAGGDALGPGAADGSDGDSFGASSEGDAGAGATGDILEETEEATPADSSDLIEEIVEIEQALESAHGEVSGDSGGDAAGSGDAQAPAGDLADDDRGSGDSGQATPDEIGALIEEEVLATEEITDAEQSPATGEGDAGLGAEGDILEETQEAAPADSDFIEEIVEIPEGLDGVEEIASGDSIGEAMPGDAVDVLPDDTDIVDEIVEVEDEAQGQTAIELGEEEVTDVAQDEEIVEVVEDESAATGFATSDTPMGEDLREKTELLSRLAEAAGVLEKLGPDLSGSIYTEEELREKAQLLSEEFDRYLSIRDKYFNAHVLIKAGNYLVGGAHLAKSVLPEQIASLPDYYIGRFPVTNALFEIFIEQTGYVTTAEKVGYGLVYFPRMQRSRDPVTGTERFSLHSQAYSKRVPGACWHRPSGPESSLHLKRTHPVVQVSLEDARAYAAWTGKRLPTEIEWEAAARTAQGYVYPWGNDWREEAGNTEQSLHGDTTPVDLYLKHAGAGEVADTLGNVLEWTLDAVGDPEEADTYIVKGASWISHGEISLTDRHYIEKDMSSNILGFRCVAI